ncbi:hypothetical protein [Neobacillus cucumis]|uniref:hypothetical protein n=1 Tax=Neobacillus cucumis TaxID=1740721 RepID=UPI002E232A51|nr:hypothetical protein [Neobacillus cucumis]
MKKLVLTFVFVIALVLPNVAEARGFSGGYSFSGGHSAYSSHTYSGGHTSTFRTRSTSKSNGVTSSDGTYHSGYTSPSSKVSKTPSTNYNTNNHSTNYTQPTRSKSGSFWTHAIAFGAGTLLGSMFHPFGYHSYGGSGAPVSYGFNFTALLIDIVIVLAIVWLFKKIFTRKRY